ncbi:MAG TPA: hypothetical protein VGG03_19850 [Thermoanaerobaculia bacterium]|jgi:hypothetical protein
MARQIAKEPRHHRRVRHAAVIAVLLLGAVSASGAEVEQGGSRKPAWKWTIDERLAARFNPEAIAARAAEQRDAEREARKKFRSGQSARAEEGAQGTEPEPVTDMIDGRKTPELFLPGELFDLLLNHVFPPEKGRADLQTSRSFFEERAAALGIGRDLWDRLEDAAAPYLRLLHEDRRHRIAEANASKGEEDGIRICRARAQALEAAEAEFGEETFLRLLYKAVAPHTRKASLLPPDYQRHAEKLRFEEGGCR